MARTNIVAQNVLGAYPATPLISGAADLSFTSTSDPLDRSAVLVDAKTMVLAKNDDASAHTITITGALDALSRKGDIVAYSVAPGQIALFGPFKTVGWAIGGVLEIDVSDADLQIAIISL